MPRPVSGAARENIVSTRLSDAEYRAVLATGVTRSVWLRQAVRAALGIAPMGTKLPPIDTRPAPPATPAKRGPREPSSLPLPAAHPIPQPETAKPHRHRRERTGDRWVGGENVGTWRCATCGVTLGILQ